MGEISLGFFITAHGLGHASRAAAVIEALGKLHPSVHFFLFTKVPQFFFEQSLTVPFTRIEMETDFGLVQTSALSADLRASALGLSRWLPFAPATISSLVQTLKELNIAAICSDISPLGLEAAKVALVPSFLIENFTWDWIYDRLEPPDPRFKEAARYLGPKFVQADFHIQTTPFCGDRNSDLVSLPVSRAVRKDRETTRAELGVKAQEKLILLTLGGTKGATLPIPAQNCHQDWFFVCPGAAEAEERGPGWLKLPYAGRFYHPDLMEAADLVVCKLGYSTLAEAWSSGTPVLYLGRPDFPESAFLEAFLASHSIPSSPLTLEAVEQGTWGRKILPLLDQKQRKPGLGNGAEQIAVWISNHLAVLQKP
ncbi:MAG: hypothetical protein A2600_03930 [Candidatus Lambdaproteobacteria bacterium RIFOXYD1_FULL_56_27]|uniref:Glycosyl transferase family 28 C-terminal domain-containing protein n=1 Tax=Candidatus Lambdaproteobacteria bacterium RIFOXYD2_FULL_56_26 TaxID=1817773 RepID=A0A1F6H3E5_9PROT|nr:MAG: hypothetical protein A2426_01730 [Candidatus Lambdaproteobacteria bacterium RIFOXYC1_FULL_56_13]OGH04908.1 MAG: hypothetical protein A2557_07995 [Candidatus Lambdaproteobacteria bacterium RIFOXYD2_FULL_56_26]OGH09372.1 MAG: hypothetical protein A2600_03930 [Candidatus Lambdaproteobacteria bacterium RIFOXYD1_FULL_56_27]